jgi:hypothetical protein
MPNFPGIRARENELGRGGITTRARIAEWAHGAGGKKILARATFFDFKNLLDWNSFAKKRPPVSEFVQISDLEFK